MRFSRCIRRAAALGLFVLLGAMAGRAEEIELPDVTLVDQDGAPVPLHAELERPGPLLLQFIFTTCSTVCPVLGATFAAVQDRLSADTRLLSISIDPEEDTPERLREHAARLRAGSRWRFLTGRPADVIAVEKAFNAYPGDKMRHRPLTFLRAGPGGPWLRLDGLPSTAELLAALRSLEEPGRRLYREGLLPSGAPLRGTMRGVQGDVVVEGAAASCAGCHRRSGYGGVEGREAVPPVTAPKLFTSREPQRGELFSQLFQEDLSPSALARLRSLGTRPAYTTETLATILRDGRDPTGRLLDPLMPRYRLDARETAALIDYLRTLGAAPAPGVDAREIHFATLFAPGVEAGRRRAVLDVLEAFFRRKNADRELRAQRPGSSPRYKDDLAGAARTWVLHVWDLTGPPESWGEQLTAHAREQPVFAVLSGAGDGDWTPVHDFCEREEIPCLFPETDLPPATPGAYSLYLSAGLTLEAEALGRHLRRLHESAPTAGLRVLQIWRDEPRSAVPAAALRRALARAPGVYLEDRLEDRQPAGNLAPGTWDAVVLWLPAADVLKLTATSWSAPVPRLYLSWSLLGETLPPLPAAWRGRAYFLDRFAPPGFDSPHAYRARGWLAARGLVSDDERLQLDTWLTLSLTESVLMHLVESFSRDYFVEAVERETERVPNPGVYPRLSLGPGQRFASKSCSLLRLALDGTLEPVGERIVP